MTEAPACCLCKRLLKNWITHLARKSGRPKDGSFFFLIKKKQKINPALREEKNAVPHQSLKQRFDVQQHIILMNNGS